MKLQIVLLNLILVTHWQMGAGWFLWVSGLFLLSAFISAWNEKV
jgi:hypothetical protein